MSTSPYQTSPVDCNRYIKALIDAADHNEDLRNIHDQFNIPVRYATDYIKRVGYVLSSNGNDLEQVAQVLNHNIDYMDQISSDELRKFVRNQNNFNQVLELKDIIYEEPVSAEKHNTQDDIITDDNDSMTNNQPPRGHDSQDSQDDYDPNSRRFNPSQQQNQQNNRRDRDKYVKKTHEELMRESANAEQYQVPQFKTRKELLKWVLDRISYLQKTKVDDFMLFFVSDEEHFMNNPDQLYILMFNHLGKHAADIAYERFKRMLGTLPPDQGFYNDNSGYPPGMFGANMNMMQAGMPGIMPGMGMVPGMGMMGPNMGGKNGQNNTQLPYNSNPQMYYVYKGVLPPMVAWNSPEGSMLIWEYEREQAEQKEREKKRQKFREDMQDQMDYKLQNFMDPDKLGMMTGGGGNNAGQNAISQALIAAGTHTASYVTNADGSTSVVAVPKQGNGQSSELASVSNIYTQLINTMKTINETIIQNLTKPNEYKDKLVDVAFNNLLGNMDPLAQVERTKALMESFQPPLGSAGGNIRDVIDTANFMLSSKKLDYDAKFVEKQQEREDRRWQWEREQEQRSEQESKNNTINLIKTFSELLPNAIGPLLQIVSLVKGGPGAGGLGGGLGGLGNLIGSLGGMMGQQGQQQQPQQGQGIDMNEIMGMANNMLGQMGLGGMMGGNAGGQMSQGPFGTPGGINNQQNIVGGYTPNPYASPNPVPPIDTSKFSPYFRQHVAPQMQDTGSFNPKHAAPPSDTWTSDFEANIPVWNDQPVQQQPEQQQTPTNNVYSPTPTNVYSQPVQQEEQKGPLEFDESEFENQGVDELQEYLNDIEATKTSLNNATQAVMNVLNKKKTPKAPTVERATSPKPEKIITVKKEEIVDGEQEKSITDTTIHQQQEEEGQKSDSDMGSKDSILDDIHRQANEGADSIL